LTEAFEEQSREPIRVVRIIARLNIGGPAIQAITLTKRLEAYGYKTTLVRGVEEPDEGNMDHLAEELGVRPVLVPWMRRNPSWRDIPALVSLVRILRRERPQIVHTHAAKGGTLGRVATLIAFPVRRRRPVLIHTYHGHSLTGYFSDRVAGAYRRIEQFLGRFCDRLIAVSDEVRDELVAMGVAPAEKFEVVRLGFDLSPFAVEGAEREAARDAVRAELGIPSDARVVTLIARLVPIKRVDRFLRVAASLDDVPDVRFLVVGDGELRDQLRASPEALALGDRLVWAGFRRDMPPVYFASDVVVQTSDNEGTPVALIEAQAAGVPVVSTRVGGSASVVPAGQLANVDDVVGLSDSLRTFVQHAEIARRAGVSAATRARTSFEVGRLVSDIDALYRGGHQPSRRRNTSSVSNIHSA
jgi:glycosyltransferase involved in cell wall biosynthesis